MSGEAELDPDRYIKPRGDWLHYRRKVPPVVRGLLSGAPHESTGRLKVRVPAGGAKPWPEEARAKRDVLEAADDSYWASLLAGEADEAQAARLAWERAKALCATTRFTYRPLDEQLAAPDLDDLFARLEEATRLERDGKSPERAAEAMLGGADAPPVLLSDLHDRYMATRGAEAIESKEADQEQVFRSTKARAVEDAKRAFGGDVPIDGLGEDDRLTLRAWWRGRTRPIDEEPPAGLTDTETDAFARGQAWSRERGKPVSVDTANKGLTIFGGMWAAYHKDLRRRDRVSLFRELSLESGRQAKIRAAIAGDRKIPAFTRAWIEDRILTAAALADLEPDERAVVILCAQRGYRSSEVANLLAENIVLRHAVPHLDLRHRATRHLKTTESQRMIPLDPDSARALAHFPGGFPRLRASRTLPANLGNWLDRNELRETPKHRMYSLRHAFMDRMVEEAEIDLELRQVLHGHVVALEGKPVVVYGGQGSLPLRQQILEPVNLCVDPAVWDLPDWPDPAA